MKNPLSVVVALAASLVLSTSAWAQASAGSADDAKKLAASAAEYVKKVGPDAAMKSFETDKAKWTVKDLTPWVMDAKGVMKYHDNQKMVGKDLSEMKDANGRLFTKEMIALGVGKAPGSVTYEWSHPVTKKLATKTAYIQPAGGDLFVGVSVTR